MSEKGGKGYSPFSKGGSLKGKDDSATKSAKGRKVQFSNEGNLSKGGKGDKVENGGKILTSKDTPQPLDSRVEQELPKNVKCLMDCEAVDILQGIQEQMVMLSRDPNIKIPIYFDKGLQYAKSTSKYTNSMSVRRILEPLADHGLSDSEICMIANGCPETVDEVFALVPSIKGKRSIISQLLKDVLSELAKFKQLM